MVWPGPPRPSQPAPCPQRPQEDPHLWNKFADRKLSFFNAELLRIVWSKQDETVQEFWRLLAICHTVMVQEADSECPAAASLPRGGLGILGLGPHWGTPTQAWINSEYAVVGMCRPEV